MATAEILLQHSAKLMEVKGVLMDHLKGKLRPPMIKRLSSCVNDVFNFSPVLTAYYERADSEFRKRRQIAEGMSAHDRLKLLFHDDDELIRAIAPLFKSYFFFIRAAQDCFAAILLGSINQFPFYPSMTSDIANKPESKLYKQVEGNVPGYIQWYSDFKATRDRIKQGVGNGFEFSEKTGVIIRIYKMKPDEKYGYIDDIEERIDLSYFVACLDYSTKMTEYLITLAAK